MCRTAKCWLFVILSILVVSASAAVAAEPLCAAPTYLPPVGTRAVLDGFGTQAAVSRPQDVDPARSKLRPTSCVYDPIQHQSGFYTETSAVSCADGARKVAADADADAQRSCCNLGGSVWYETQGTYACKGCLPPGYCVSGYIYYTCVLCDPPIC
jgi:hypothetical protein